MPAVELTATSPAPLTAVGTVLGTLQYMAPEQIEGAVPEGGGAISRLVTLDPTVERASQPEMLDDGRHVLFTVTPPGLGVPGEGTIVVQSVQGGERKVLVQGGTGAHVLATGQLVYLHGGSLFGVPFNPRTLEVTGAPVLLLEEMPSTGGGQFGISSDGTLVYPPCPLARLAHWSGWTVRGVRTRSQLPRPAIKIRGCHRAVRSWQ